MLIFDRVSLGDAVLTPEGYLRVPARISRTGLQDYYGWEIGQEPADRLFKVYRPADEVFAQEALDSIQLKPVTDNHPWDGVDASTWKERAVGIVGQDVTRDGDHVKATLLLTDANAINKVQRGVVELSAGYSSELLVEPGTTDAGETYDAKQTAIRVNHVAIVEQGRCGPTCRVGADHMPMTTDCNGNSRCKCQRTPQPPKGQDMTKTVTVDGKQIEVTADVASVIEALQAKVTAADEKYSALVDTSKQLADIVEAHNAVKASEVAAKDAKIAELEKKVPTADELDRLATERAALVSDAKLIVSDLDPIGKDTAAIKAEAVKAKLGDAAVEGKSADYVAAAFDMLVATAKAEPADPIRDAFKSGTTDNKANPRDKYLADTASAWQKGA